MDSGDGLKWFGEGFDGFPKKLPEDVVEYIIFIIDTRLSDIQTRERLQAFQRALQDLKKKFLKEYIWQRDEIKLDLVRENDRWLLKGQTNYGDSVADEWLIVYFLRELSREFKDAWIRIYDTDGEFLLIEAANALPKWLTPEVAEHRVWINTHRMLIIPLGKEEEPAPLKLSDAFTILGDTPGRPQQYPRVEKEAFHRLKNYPTAIAENQHHATIPLPRKVAHILHTNPSYISSAVEAFYLRDPISLRLLQPEKSKSALVFPPEDFVSVSVRFTKVLYAQLLGQHWNPTPQYESAIDLLVKSGHPQEKSEVAIKLSAGMQILASHTLFADKKAVREINLLLEDMESGDDTVPTDAEIATWPEREDDESWLDIDFSEFEKELQGKGGDKGFGDKNAQDNLKKMVERFNTFLADDQAGHEGANAVERDPMDEDNDSDPGRGWEDPESSSDDDEEEQTGASTSPSSTKPASQPEARIKSKAARADDEDDDSGSESEEEEENQAAIDAEYAEYEKYFEKYMTLPPHEKAMLTEDARELARAQDAENEEDEEIRKLTEAMEAELFGHGALNLNPPAEKASKTLKSVEKAGKVDKGKAKAKVSFAEPEDDVEEIDRGGREEGDEELLDEDYNLVQNMLAAFKGQAGAAGPAGNMLRAMGIQLPQDADDEVQGSGSKGYSNVGEGRASENPMRKQDWYMK
ncbi:SGT1-domain-containing protein [Didymella exigua CBS 183.55]|uniref:SGT1-domain-containing protein n=1 Tax=Didymella exigua CBS 183.55 TaxID=1150837 RepID=A0A6A5RNE8_9PLEO|nr:SGT1-domain-containing protein [Didymella exigua CBS 183.55]KAF1928830.1 SGT1-domain-containing protein [Didymella exigua CBS 183.55]